MNIQEYIKKLQNLSDGRKKIILWTIVVILVPVLIFVWFKNTKERFESFKRKEFISSFNFSDFGEEIGKISGLESETETKKEELKKIEDSLKILKDNPEKLEELEKLSKENPQKFEELMKNPEKLEEFLKEIEKTEEFKNISL